MKKTFYILFLFSVPLFSQIQVGAPINIIAEHIETSYSGNKIAILEDANHAVNVKTYIYENSVWTTNPSNDIYVDVMGAVNSSLSMSKDGNFLAVGSSNRNYNNPDPNLMGIGIVRIYENINDLWIQVGDDLMTGNEIDDFGISWRGNGIDLSADGSVIAIGAPNYYGSGTFGDGFGLVKVFGNNNGNWVQMGTDIIGSMDSHTGTAVSLSDDGLTMAVGAAHSQNTFGDVKIYNFQNDDWVQIGNQINGESENDLLTYTMSLSADGNRLALSTPNPGNFTMGYAKVFENINNDWVQIDETISSDGTIIRFGIRLSYSSDGSVLALNSNGGARVYKVTEDTITELGLLIDTEGSPMSLSSDGSFIIVKNISEVIVYDISDITLSNETYKSPIVSFFPNPANNELNVILDKNNSLKRMSFFTIIGKEMLTSNKTHIDTSSLPSGIYIVVVETEMGISHKKLIIE